MPGDDSASEGGGRAGPGTVLLWASLVPVAALSRPYGGLVQDARIYLGRGLADGDPAGLGRDLLFAGDGQTGFSLFGPIVRGLLTVLSPGQASMLLASAGIAVWLAAAVALARRVAAAAAPGAPDRLAWGMVVAMLVLPSAYGGFGTFGYGEAIATPRVFAEAAVLAGFAALVAGRRAASLACLLLAGAIHPLMALPGLAVGALVLIADDRRWAVPVGAAVSALLVGAALKLPLLDRLFTTMDPTWLGILRERSLYLFPTAWPSDAYGTIAFQSASALIAGSFAPPRVRKLLWSVVGVALGGVLISLAFGDLLVSVLVAQLQPWRALWLLAAAGNAGFVLAAVGAWRAGGRGRLVLAVLIMTWASQPTAWLAITLAVVAVALRAGRNRSPQFVVSPMMAWAALAAALGLVAVAVGTGGLTLLSVFRSMGDRGGEPLWPYVVVSGVLAAPSAAIAVAVALAPPLPLMRRAPILAGSALLALLCWGAAATWDSRRAELRMADGRDGAAELALALGPGMGGVLWIDEDSQTWFVARRAAYFNFIQGGPMLFSRDLALSWAERARRLQGWGLLREGDLTVGGEAGDGPTEDIVLTPGAVTRFCADPSRPAALVAPGAQLAAVPPGLAASLWSPPQPIRRLSAGGDVFRWRTITTFTVVNCGGGSVHSGDESLKSVNAR